MENNKRIQWLDGLKYFACIGVFFSHFIGTFSFDSVVSDFGFSTELSSFLHFFKILTNGNFWVAVFCIISGMFAAKSRINNLTELSKKIFFRYLRFVVPFVFMSLIILLIDRTIGFHSAEYGEIFGNTWLGYFYNESVSFIDIIKCIFIFDSKINNVLWTIMPILVGNIVIYVFRFIITKFNISYKAESIVSIILLLIFTVICIALKSTFIYSCSCCFGAILPQINSYIKNIPKNFFVILFINIIIVFHFHNDIINILIPKIAALNSINPDILLLNTVWHQLYAILLVLIIFNLPLIQKFFEIKIFRKINFSSFSIYIFHCPIIFSISLLLYENLINIFSYTTTFIINLFVTTFIVVIFAIIYEKTVGKLCNSILNKIKKVLN